MRAQTEEYRFHEEGRLRTRKLCVDLFQRLIPLAGVVAVDDELARQPAGEAERELLCQSETLRVELPRARQLTALRQYRGEVAVGTNGLEGARFERKRERFFEALDPTLEISVEHPANADAVQRVGQEVEPPERLGDGSAFSRELDGPLRREARSDEAVGRKAEDECFRACRAQLLRPLDRPRRVLGSLDAKACVVEVHGQHDLGLRRLAVVPLRQ